jgi:hypothetical protein
MKVGSHNSFSFHFLFFILFMLAACARPAPGTYTSDPSKREDKAGIRELQMEIYILENNSVPITGMEVKAETTSSSQKKNTNFRGRARLSVKRAESEPIKFVFKKDGYTSVEIVHHIPSNVSDAGLVFSFDRPGSVKFVKYTVKGLYR